MAGPAEDPPKRNTEAGLEEASLEATGLEDEEAGLEETSPVETGLENKEDGLEETGLEETGPPTGGLVNDFLRQSQCPPHRRRCPRPGPLADMRRSAGHVKIQSRNFGTQRI